MQPKDRAWMVPALFFCSGAAALVYEVVWSKFLSQLLGSTAYAQTIVLATFMGGLAIGNRLFGRLADRQEHPLRLYGYLEIGIGLYAFFFLVFYSAADAIFIAIGSKIADSLTLLLVLKAFLSAALLLGPTILMGGTLPLLAGWLQKTFTDSGRLSARFYSINSLGAVAGAMIAGFWLVTVLGLDGALKVTGFVNVLVGGAAVLLGRQVSLRPQEPARTSKSAAPEIAASAWRTACFVVAATGGISMGLEVLASRSLAMVFGSSLRSFAIVLMAFILGIGLGSAWIASPRRTLGSAEKWIVMLLAAAAGWVALLVFGIERWTDVYRILITGVARSTVGYVFHQFLTGGMALVILGIPAAAIGAVLPLMIRALSQPGTPLGRQVGALLTWNTLGAVGGTLLTGFVLMPRFGLRNAIGILALALGTVALVVAWRRKWNFGIGSAALACVASVFLFFNDDGWKHVLSMGAFRLREVEFDPDRIPLRKKHMKIPFYKDAPDATVSVEQGDGIETVDQLCLRINGKPDASSEVDLCTQVMLAHVPMLAKPDAKDVFVLGFGSGTTAGALMAYPVERIHIGENCAPVIEAAKFFEPWNRKVLNDPRVRVFYEDARTTLRLHPGQFYDVIITEPSNPWTAGVGGVFSREFYELAASRLKPGGVVAQWFHLYEMHDGIVAMVLRTFGSVFPYVEIWDTGPGDILILGSTRPWRSHPDVFRQGFQYAGVRSDLEKIGIKSPEAFLARQTASQRTAFAIAGDGPIESDLFPMLENAAVKAFFIGERARLLDGYDERTYQQLLAPPEKQTALRSLSEEEVNAVFLFESINTQLLAAIRRAVWAAEYPCVFGTNAPSVEALANKSSTNAVALHQVAVALNAGDFQRAEQLLSPVLDDPLAGAEAAYLARILMREREHAPVATPIRASASRP